MTVPNDLIVTPESGLITEVDGNFTVNTSVLEAMAAAQAANTNSGCGPCGNNPGPCTYFWSLGAQSIQNGDAQTISLVGAPPGLRVSFTFDMPGGVKFVTNIVADSNGMGTKRIVVLNGNGIYTVTASACGCGSNPACKTFTVCPPAPVCAEVSLNTSASACVAASGNLFSGGEIFSTACDRAVTVVPKFATPSVNSGGYVSLEVRVTNTNNVPVTFTLGNVTLPPELSGTVSIPQVVVNGQSTLVRTFTLTASSGVNADAVVTIGSGVGTYICGGQQYSASGGQDLVAVVAPSGGFGCDLRVEVFAWTPANILNGGTTQLQLVLKNYGAATVTNVAVAAISGPATFTGTALATTGATIAPGATLSLTSSGVIEHTAGTPQTLTAFAPAGTITYTCNGGNFNIGAAIQTSIVVAAGTIANGYCQGTLSWENPLDGTVRAYITGALANTQYSWVSTGAIANAGQFTTDATGYGFVDFTYGVWRNAGQLVVNVTAPSPNACQFPELSIQLPSYVVSEGA